MGGFKFWALIVDDCSDYMWGRFFNKKSELNQHKEINHAVANPEKKYCDICCKHFANLAQHQKIVHSGVKNFKCQNCQKGFYDNRELRRHHIKFLKNKECKKNDAKIGNDNTNDTIDRKNKIITVVMI